MGQMTRKRFLMLGFGVSASGVLWVACGDQKQASSDPPGLARPSRDQWPEVFWTSAPEVQEAYRYAVANPDVLQWIPCFCGCVNGGHTSNKDCYVREFRRDGSVVLDPMSFG